MDSGVGGERGAAELIYTLIDIKTRNQTGHNQKKACSKSLKSHTEKGNLQNTKTKLTCFRFIHDELRLLSTRNIHRQLDTSFYIGMFILGFPVFSTKYNHRKAKTYAFTKPCL